MTTALDVRSLVNLSLQECAVALKDFGDGASVMGLFVNQHQFFIDRSQLITEDISGDAETYVISFRSLLGIYMLICG